MRQSCAAGFAEVDITPSLDRGPVWLAGFQQHRSAQGVHDPIMARAVVLTDGAKKIALVSVDLIGLQYPAVQQIRACAAGVRLRAGGKHAQP